MTITEPDADDLPWDRCREPGCLGVRSSVDACLRHLSEEERVTALRIVGRGRPVDVRGVAFDAALLARLLDACPCDDAGRPILKATRFDRATFPAGAAFSGVVFEKEVSFDRARFEGDADFRGTRFNGLARFARTTVAGGAAFDEAVFGGQAWFAGTTFAGRVSFRATRFASVAWFSRAEFSGDVDFGQASFRGDANFDATRFAGATSLAGAAFSGEALLGKADFARQPDYKGATFSSQGAVPEGAVREAMRTGFAYARWHSRAAALLIDALTPLAVVAAGAGLGALLEKRFEYAGAFVGCATVALAVAVVLVLAALVGQGRTGQTRGKRRLDIRLVRERDGHSVGAALSLVRAVLHLLDTLLLLLGWLRPLWNRKRQTIADSLARTVVVKGRGMYGSERPPPPSSSSCC